MVERTTPSPAMRKAPKRTYPATANQSVSIFDRCLLKKNMYHFPKKSIVGRAAVASIGWAKASFRSYVEMVDLTSENDFDAILREASIVLCDS